jgi:cytochrome c
VGFAYTSSYSFDEMGCENINGIIVRVNGSIKTETNISEFPLWAFKLKALLSYLKYYFGNNF